MDASGNHFFGIPSDVEKLFVSMLGSGWFGIGRRQDAGHDRTSCLRLMSKLSVTRKLHEGAKHWASALVPVFILLEGRPLPPTH